MAAIPLQSIARVGLELDRFLDDCRCCEFVPENVKEKLQNATDAMKSLEQTLRQWIRETENGENT